MKTGLFQLLCFCFDLVVEAILKGEGKRNKNNKTVTLEVSIFSTELKEAPVNNGPGPLVMCSGIRVYTNQNSSERYLKQIWWPKDQAQYYAYMWHLWWEEPLFKIELVKIRFLLYSTVGPTLFGVTSLNLSILHITIHKYLGVFSVTLLSLALTCNFWTCHFHSCHTRMAGSWIFLKMACEMRPYLHQLCIRKIPKVENKINF